MLSTLCRRSGAVVWAARCASTSSAIKNNQIGVVGAPFHKGQRREGVKDGPRVIRDTGVLQDLHKMGLEVVDHGDVEEGVGSGGEAATGLDGERNHRDVLEYNRCLAAAVSKVVAGGSVCATLGGDHSIAIGTINGHAHARHQDQVVVLWVDAHADLNTGRSSLSGNMHGMPVSHHLHELSKAGINRLPDGWPAPCLASHHLVYIGLRDIDQAEQAYMDQLGIVNFGMREVDRYGLEKVVEQSLAHLQPSTTRPLHLSFDIDSLDPLEAPSTGTPVRGGLSLRDGLLVCEEVHRSGFLGALDLVEVNPSLGSPHDAALTASAARLILLSALAGYRGC